MDNLIKINYETGEPMVSARDLHDGLDIKSNFTTWFDRMLEYGFTDADYKKCFPNLESGSNGGQNMVDYEVSVDMAKQICMIQRTEKGRQYRQYFLDLEKAWNTPDQVLARALKLANITIEKLTGDKTQLIEEVNIKNQLIGELKPKADYMDKILKNPGLVTITQIAKDYGMSGQEMNNILHGLKVQYKQSGQWLLYKEHQNCGYTHSNTVDITHSDGRPDVRMNTKWTQKGRLFLYQLLKDNGILPTIEKNVA